jgi:hypothetical protein
MDELFAEIEQQVKAWRTRVKLVLPNHLTALVAELHRFGRVLDISYREDGMIALTAHVPPQLQSKIKPYMVPGNELDHAGDGAGGTPEGAAAEPGGERLEDIRAPRHPLAHRHERAAGSRSR